MSTKLAASDRNFSWCVSFDDEAETPHFLTHKDFLATQEEAFQLGKKEGITEAQGSLEQKLDETLALLSQRVEALMADNKAYHDELTLACLSFLSMALKILTPYYASDSLMEELHHALKEAILRHAQLRLILSLHPTMAARLRQVSWFASLEAHLELDEDETYALTDYRVHWHSGYLIKDLNALLTTLDDKIKNLASHLSNAAFEEPVES